MRECDIFLGKNQIFWLFIIKLFNNIYEKKLGKEPNMKLKSSNFRQIDKPQRPK